MKCPFRKKKTTAVEYSNRWPSEGKPKTITKTEEFCDCECSCKAYDNGICQMMKESR